MKDQLLKNSLNYGLKYGLLLIIASFGLYFIRSHIVVYLSYLSVLIAILGMVLGTKWYRDIILEGFISYKTALFSGFLIGFFSSIVNTLFNIIMIFTIDPFLYNKFENIGKGLLAKNYAIGLFTSLITNLILAAIVAVFLQKKNLETVIQETGDLQIDPAIIREQEKERNKKDLIYGFLWLIGGILVTAITYSIASQDGGTYVIAYGAIIVGGLQFIKGLIKYFSNK